jgi:hypothetical protein
MSVLNFGLDFRSGRGGFGTIVRFIRRRYEWHPVIFVGQKRNFNKGFAC